MSGEGGEDEAEKSHEPSQKRLDEARKRGEVPQSQDLATAAAYGGFLLAAWGLGAGSLLTLGGALASVLAQAAPLSEDMFAGSPQPLWGSLFAETASAMWPWFFLPGVAALLCFIAQNALVIAPERITPKLTRISPLGQMKQKFGLHGLVEFGKGLVKVTLYGAVLGVTLARATPDLVGAAGQEPAAATRVLLGIALDLIVKVVLVAIVIGLVDVVWQRISFRQRHMMSRQELVEEMKESEGDPHLKQARRQKAVGLAMNQMLAEVPKASVVIVNPTHYAVALGWDRAKGGAPVCLAKGVDEMAARIRERAIEAGVPIRRDPPTARAIYASVEIGQEVGRPEWRAVAAAIRFAERMRTKERPAP